MNDRRDSGVANALGLVLIAPASIGLALLVVCRLREALLLLRLPPLLLQHVHAHSAELRLGLRLRLVERRRLAVPADIRHRFLRGAGGGRLGAPVRLHPALP